MDTQADDQPPSRAPFLFWLRITVAIVFAVSGVGLVVDWQDRQDPPQPVTTISAPTTMAVKLRLRAGSYGLVRVGMTWEAALAAGVDPADDLPTCRIGSYEGATIYAEDVVLAIIVQEPRVLTVRGIHVGSSRFEVESVYAGLVAPTENQLVAVEGAHEMVFGLRDGVVVYLWARAVVAEDVGC